MKILITGAHGQLAQTIMHSTQALEHELFFTARTVESNPASDSRYQIGRLDITDADAVLKMVSDNKIDVIINCAGYTNVAKAEIEKAAAFKANAEAVTNLANAAKSNNALLVHISTDYVYDGEAETPYKETDMANPLNEYGRSKLAGDEIVLNSGCRCLIFRVSWLYSPYGNNFFKTILKKSNELPSINVVNDQTGTPTYAPDLVDAVFYAIDSDARGLYNFTNEGQCTWFEFAKEICHQADSKCEVKPCKTEDYPTNVERPKYSVLDKNKFKTTFGKSIPHWKDALVRCLKQTDQKYPSR